jgi:hypothetical protein
VGLKPQRSQFSTSSRARFRWTLCGFETPRATTPTARTWSVSDGPSVGLKRAAGIRATHAVYRSFRWTLCGLETCCICHVSVLCNGVSDGPSVGLKHTPGHRSLTPCTCFRWTLCGLETHITPSNRRMPMVSDGPAVGLKPLCAYTRNASSIVSDGPAVGLKRTVDATF